jgi:hypothetical protein
MKEADLKEGAFANDEGGAQTMKGKNKTRSRRVKRSSIGAAVALLLGSILLLVTFAGAEGEYGFPTHYPPGFDGQGRIDRIAVEEVVIDDIFWKFSPDVKYHTKATENASRAWFKVGSRAGFVKDAGNRISALYLIEKPKP